LRIRRRVVQRLASRRARRIRRGHGLRYSARAKRPERRAKGYGCEGGVSMSAGVLLVAGGSRGIGEAIAVLGAERGYDVVLSFVKNEARAAAVVERIRAAGGKAVAVQADTAHEAD